MQKNNFPCVENIPSVSPSFAETLEKAKVQIDYDCFPFGLLPMANELAMIMTEVFRMRPTDRIQIDDTLHTVSDVQAAYSELRNEHIIGVIEKFNAITYRIKRPRRYLRSMLYSEVFEHESTGANLFSSTSGGGV